MSGRRRRFFLARWFGDDEAGHRVKRINNPGEAVLKIFFFGCLLAIVLGLAVVIVHDLAWQPEFRPLAAEDIAQ